jgi:hypothetical protein
VGETVNNQRQNRNFWNTVMMKDNRIYDDFEAQDRY